MSRKTSNMDKLSGGNYCSEIDLFSKYERSGTYLTAPPMDRYGSTSSHGSYTGSETSYYENNECSPGAAYSTANSPFALTFENDYSPIYESYQPRTYVSSAQGRSQRSPDIAAAAQPQPDLPPFDPRKGDKRIGWQMYYDYQVSKDEAYWILEKGYISSSEFPERRPDERSYDNNGKQNYPCRYQGCKAVPFSRCWDLKRHYKTHCATKEKDEMFCDYKVCPSSRNRNPFDRKDHCREHYREVHQEDLTRRNAESNVEAWLKDRQTNPEWWRCNKCLNRVKIRKYKYTCNTCNAICESKRVIARKEKAKDEGRHEVIARGQPRQLSSTTGYVSTSTSNVQAPSIRVATAQATAQQAEYAEYADVLNRSDNLDYPSPYFEYDNEEIFEPDDYDDVVDDEQSSQGLSTRNYTYTMQGEASQSRFRPEEAGSGFTPRYKY